MQITYWDDSLEPGLKNVQGGETKPESRFCDTTDREGRPFFKQGTGKIGPNKHRKKDRQKNPRGLGPKGKATWGIEKEQLP